MLRAPTAFVEVLLADGEPDEAWAVATSTDVEPGQSLWLRLAEAREPSAPVDAMAVYLAVADDVLAKTDKRAYRDAVRYLKAARRVAGSAGCEDVFADALAGVRDRNRRRPTFLAMLDKAGLR